MGRQVRIGIDVGGTFTKAVVLDDDTHEIIAQAVVATTHTAAEGVAAGVIEAFRRSLASARVTPTEVVFIAHSTTQATNALLEGDVAPVGVIGMGRGAVESRLARSQTMIGDIELSAGRLIACRHAFIRSDDLTDAAVRAAVAELQRQGVRVIVASDAFSVDDARAEEQVMAVAGELGLPAAGGLMYLRVSDGIFFEVGGTSTNIGVIQGGRPTIAFAEVGGHRTYISSLDVRVLGIAGGSMVRVAGDRIVGVGPRSAHIAGLPYAAFQPPETIVDPAIELVQPKPGDPGDYVAVRLGDGRRVALTNTDAANVLGLVKPGDYAYGSPGAARPAIAPPAPRLGVPVEAGAPRVLRPPRA